MSTVKNIYFQSLSESPVLLFFYILNFNDHITNYECQPPEFSFSVLIFAVRFECIKSLLAIKFALINKICFKFIIIFIKT